MCPSNRVSSQLVLRRPPHRLLPPRVAACLQRAFWPLDLSRCLVKRLVLAQNATTSSCLRFNAVLLKLRLVSSG